LIILGELATDNDASNLSSLTFLRAIRVLRVFKTVSVIPGKSVEAFVYEYLLTQYLKIITALL